MTSKGRLARPLLAVTLAAMLTCAIFISVFATTNAEASFATLEKGDKFALKGERDLSMGYHSVNQLITLGDEENDWYRNAIIDNASLNGYMSSVMVCEVIDVTADEYVVKVSAAQNLSLDVELLLTGELVNTGSYITYWDDYYSSNPDGLMNISEADTTVGTFGFDAKLVAGANETYVIHLQKSDMAIKSVDMEASVYARGHLNVCNFPNSTTDYDSINDLDITNITAYESFSSNVTLDLRVTGELSFDPYVTAVQDSPEEDSTWEVDTYVNGTFNWVGLLDVTGLPESVTDEMFDDDAADHGVTGFPIDLAKIYDSGSDPAINNGTIEIAAEPANFEFSNLGNTVVNDPVYGNITIYRLGFNNATQENYLEAWYYPAEGCLVGIELNYPMPGIGKLTLDMKSVSVTEAEETLADISEQVADKDNYEQVNQVTAVGGSSNGLMSLLPIIALIAVAVIAVVGIVFVVKRRSKPKA